MVVAAKPQAAAKGLGMIGKAFPRAGDSVRGQETRAQQRAGAGDPRTTG